MCTHTRQVEHQRCSKAGRVQKISKFEGKNTKLMNNLYKKFKVRFLLDPPPISLDFFFCGKFNFPLAPYVVYKLVGRSAIISKKGRKLQFHAPVGALIIFSSSYHNYSFVCMHVCCVAVCIAKLKRLKSNSKINLLYSKLHGSI